MRLRNAIFLASVSLHPVVAGGVGTPATRPTSAPSTEPAAQRPAVPKEPHLHSLYNLTVLGRFIMMHTNENNAYPAMLKSLPADGYVTKKDLDVLMTNPIARKPRPKGYKYLKPADALLKDFEKQAKTPLVVELKADGTVDPDGSCLFADGHVGPTPAGIR